MKTLADVALSIHSLGEIDLETRAEAASAAGFERIGLSVRRTLAWLQEHSLGDLDRLLDTRGLRVGELEVLAPMRSQPDPNVVCTFELARALGCGAIQITGPYDGTRAEAIDRLRAIAWRAEDEGVQLSLEFLPWTNIPSAAVAADLVGEVGSPALGICVDVWHLYRSGGTPADLEGLWPLVTALQLDDGPLQSEQPDDLLADCLHHRRLPGAGEFDLTALLVSADDRRGPCSLSVEVISDELRALPPVEAATRIADAVAAALATVPNPQIIYA